MLRCCFPQWSSPVALYFDVFIPSAARRLPTVRLPQVEPKGDRVLVKVGEQEEKTRGGILLPVSAQKRPTSGAGDVPNGGTSGEGPACPGGAAVASHAPSFPAAATPIYPCS